MKCLFKSLDFRKKLRWLFKVIFRVKVCEFWIIIFYFICL